MKRETFVDILNRLFEKAELEYIWHASGDEDEDANIYVNERGEIYIKEEKTTYLCSEVSKMRFRKLFFDVDVTGEEHDFYVKVWFETGKILRFGMKDYVSYVREEVWK